MRLTFFFAVVVAATLHANGASLPLTKDSDAVVKNEDSPAIADLTDAQDGGRLLRRVEKDEYDIDDFDDFDEERAGGFGETVKKLNPVRAVKTSLAKAAAKTEKARKALKEAGDYQKLLERARAMVDN